MRLLYNDPSMKPRRKALRRHQTVAEALLWQHLRKERWHGYRFMRQYGVGPYILDFYCPAVRVAIELDGSQHMEKDAKEYDRQREIFLNAQDIRVLRFWNNDVLSNVRGVLQRIEEVVVRGV